MVPVVWNEIKLMMSNILSTNVVVSTYMSITNRADLHVQYINPYITTIKV